MPKITLEHLTRLDWSGVERELVEWLRSKFREAGVENAVVGVSGGVDSATTLALTVKALGADRVHALIMPDSRVTPREDVEDAISVCEKFGVKYTLVAIDPIYDAFARALPFYSSEATRANGNLRARIRMCTLYYYANRFNALVVGTGDRSEILIGYFTKWGDGAVDLLPIGVLYKTQIRRLAAHLGVPERIVAKPSSPRLWRGHLAEEELGMKYEEIDLALHAMVDHGLGVEEAAEATGLPVEKVRKVKEMMEASKHKREPPPAPPLEAVKRYWLDEK